MMTVIFAGHASAAVQTLAATELRSYSATLNGVVNPAGNETVAWFEWGATTNYGQVTPFQLFGSGTSNFNFSQSITGLVVEATYHFRAVSSNAVGIAVGSNLSFATPVFDRIETSLPVRYAGGAAWGDWNNDGRLDILLMGSGGGPPQVWSNTGSGFAPIDLPAPDISLGGVAWFDSNNDGWLDFILTGYSYSFEPDTADLWRNTGSGFIRAEAGLGKVSYSSTACVDYDNDGRMDVFLAGWKYGPGHTSKVWRNTGARFLDQGLGLPQDTIGTAAWGDFDNDGRADVLFTGRDSLSNYVAQIWRNSGFGLTNFNAGLTPHANRSVAWGDFDNDGLPDVLLCGDTASEVFRNTGQGFTNINAGLPSVTTGSVACGDYDNDGRLDILLNDQVYRNTGNGFTNINAGLPPTFDSAAAWGDFDNDGRLDIILLGDNGYSHSLLFKNNTLRTNTPPQPPSNLSAVASGAAATFTWSTGSDAETPATGLTYNLRVGTTPGGCDIVSPLSGSDGRRRVPQMGNVQMVRAYQLVNLPVNQTIYWSVQSVDTAFAGSAFAPEQSFHLTGFVSPVAGPVAGDLNGDGVVNDADLSSLLQTCWTNQPPVISGFRRLGTNDFEFILTNLAALDFVVNVSTNLTDWQSLGPAAVRYQFTDTNAASIPQRNYRLRWP